MDAELEAICDWRSGMREMIVRLLKAVYRYEKERDRLLREEGVEMGHTTLVERITRKYGQSREEKLLILETLASFRGED
jgi:hypothetical protein